LLLKYPDQFRHSRRNFCLAPADTDAGAQRRKLRGIIITAKTELLSGEVFGIRAD
jgi:hypothetical protein